jgi:hypothetical protein
MNESIYIKLGWVKPIIIEKFKGITIAALDKKRQRGVLIEETHWRKADDNVIYFNFEKLDEYIANEH